MSIQLPKYKFKTENGELKLFDDLTQEDFSFILEKCGNRILEYEEFIMEDEK